MKKLFIIVLSFLFCFTKVNASEYITYSDWIDFYPYWLDPIFIQSENRYLWYREVLNEETNEIEREYANDYYSELDGYIKDEDSLKTFYRYITNERVIFDSEGNIVYDIEYCNKNYCVVRSIPKVPVNEEIENPKTYDNIFVFMIISFLSFVFIVILIGLKQNKSSFVESI